MEYTIRQDDVLMSYLPLAHMFERCCEVSRVLVRMTRKKMIIIKFIYLALLLLNTHTHTPPPFAPCHHPLSLCRMPSLWLAAR